LGKLGVAQLGDRAREREPWREDHRVSRSQHTCAVRRVPRWLASNQSKGTRRLGRASPVFRWRGHPTRKSIGGSLGVVILRRQPKDLRVPETTGPLSGHASRAL
jgi:hypothetical protein